MSESQIKQKEFNKVANLLGEKRITEEEINLLKSVFGDTKEIYIALRNMFFGLPLDETEKNLLQRLQTEKIKTLLYKLFLPEIQKDIPVGQTFDLWQTKDISEANEDNFDRIFETKEILLGKVKKGLALLDNLDGEKNSLVITKSLPDLLARNSFISYIDSQIRMIMSLANSKEMTPEQMMEKIKRDSTK